MPPNEIYAFSVRNRSFRLFSTGNRQLTRHTGGGRYPFTPETQPLVDAGFHRHDGLSHRRKHAINHSHPGVTNPGSRLNNDSQPLSVTITGPPKVN